MGILTEVTVNALDRVDELVAAIRKHRDQGGDDRCWLDDRELYSVLRDSEGYTIVANLTLPPKCEFLESCSRYWNQRQSKADKTLGAGGKTIGQLERENFRLREALTLFADRKNWCQSSPMGIFRWDGDVSPRGIAERALQPPKETACLTSTTPQ